MMNAAEPILENWYKDLSTARTFRIVAIDEEADSIEVQYFNGDIGEYDFASWFESGFLPIEAPEDWAAPFDVVETDDLGYTDTDIHGPELHELTLNDLLNEEKEY
jgi:hypothetical protein